MSLWGTVLDIGKKFVTTVVTRFATNMANKASSSLDSKPPAQRETKSKELTALERKYLEKKDQREQIALEIQREQLRLQAHIHKENIELSLKQIQADYDKDRWAGILSRDETVDVLRSSQEKHHLLMLLSEPEISPSCPDSFKHDLPIAVRNELKQFMQSEYPFQNELYPVQFFGKFFESRIFDAHVKQFERLLNSVPTVVLYSQMTDENLYLHIHGWGFGDITLTETCTFNWEAVYEQFHKEGTSDKDAYKAIRKMIVALHQAFAAFCSDFYYLTVINPLHEPRLFHVEFSEELQMVVEPLKQSLQTICVQNRQRYEKELLDYQEGLDGNSRKTNGSGKFQEWQTVSKFKTRADGIARDEQHGLMWCRFAIGQTWQNGTAENEAKKMKWADALEMVKTFNANGGYAGFTDWRLPMINELKTLIDREKGKAGSYIDEDVFPNNYRWFWCLSFNPESAKNSNFDTDEFLSQFISYGGQWGIDFYDGSDANDSKDYSYAVRLVRTTPEHSWQTLGKFKMPINDIFGIAKDERTGLMWLRFAYGQTWEKHTSVGEINEIDWYFTKYIVDIFNARGGYAGFTDWRLPNIDELKSLIDKVKGKEGNYIDADVFPCNGYSFWSSSLSKSSFQNLLIFVDFTSGNDSYVSKTGRNTIRLVRGQ